MRLRSHNSLFDHDLHEEDTIHQERDDGVWEEDPAGQGERPLTAKASDSIDGHGQVPPYVSQHQSAWCSHVQKRVAYHNPHVPLQTRRTPPKR
jgi:hypothetical protein